MRDFTAGNGITKLIFGQWPQESVQFSVIFAAVMKIAVNARFLLKGKLEGIGWFTHEIMRRVVNMHPEHQFVFFFDRPFDTSFLYAKNVEAVVLNPPARHPFLWWIWFEWAIPRALKKHQADIFISTDGFLSLRTQIPTLLVMHDLAFEHFPEHLPLKFRWYLRRFSPKFAKRANRIIAVSEYTRNDIVSTYGIESSKVDVIFNGANAHYRPLNFDEKTEIRAKYAEGAEYFVFAGALHPRKNVVNLLEAFTIFKKKQRSNMKLLIIGRYAWNAGEIEAKISNHPFKEDVIRYDYMQVEELSKVIGAAYGLVFVSLFEGFGIPVLEALKCRIPVIASDATSIPEVAGEAALYANTRDVQDIAEKMCLFYKDEHRRNQLINACDAQAAKFDWDRSAEQFYESILSALK
jgi:glycosyltransferase involved in cell wall biosynthesis